MQLPNQPSIQIVQLTRGSVVIAGQGAYACTNAADILTTVAQLLPADGSLGDVQPAPMPQQAPPPVPDPPPVQEPGNPLYQRDNLLRLCDAWVQERISDEQFDEYLAQVCPDINQEEAYMTRESFGPVGAESSQLNPDMLDGAGG